MASVFCLNFQQLLMGIFLFPCFFFISQEEAAAIKAAGKAWYQTMISDSDYTEFENFTKWLGVSQ
jgi:hypothetical protein